MKNVLKAIKQHYKLGLKGVALLAALGIISIYSYKLYYLNKDVPSSIELQEASDNIIQVDGAIMKASSFSLKRAASPLPASILARYKSLHMPAKTSQLLHMIKEGKKQIYIRIDSPGGRLDVGQEFIDAIHVAQNRGVKVTCIVDGLAASMATIILSECDERLATVDSRIMWHSILVGGRMRLNVYSTSKLLKFMIAKNEEVWANTRIHFWPWYFIENFELERLIPAVEVESEGIGYLRVINKLSIIKKPTTKIKVIEKPVIKQIQILLPRETSND